MSTYFFKNFKEIFEPLGDGSKMVKKAKIEPSPSGKKSQNRTVPKWLKKNSRISPAVFRLFYERLTHCDYNIVFFLTVCDGNDAAVYCLAVNFH